MLYWGVIAAVWAFIVIEMVAATVRTIPGVAAWLLAMIIMGSVSIGSIWRARE